MEVSGTPVFFWERWLSRDVQPWLRFAVEIPPALKKERTV